jgi:Catalytic LigB subunit of aromatic ring-opening dioxygenase
MAQLVGGIAVSHSPQLSIPADGWLRHGQLEQPRLRELDLPGPNRGALAVQAELREDLLQSRYAQCQVALETSARALEAMAPDILVVIGDDQRELFLDDVMPAVSVFWGDEMYDRPPGMAAYPASMAKAYTYYHADSDEAYRTNSRLGLHLVEDLVRNGFDLAQLTEQPAGRSLGHAFTFVYRRVLEGSTLTPDLVPIFLNTYYPPNQPTPQRCIDLGRGIGAAIESWPVDQRVALVASGGLTHPIIDEELDRRVLAGLENRDWADLARLPVDALVEGTSEIRNWLTVGAALDRIEGRTVDYIPAYRSEMGSGCGMGFFVWSDGQQ